MLAINFLLAVHTPAWLRLSRRSATCKEPEILLLRHQLAVLQRTSPPRPRLARSDRAWLAALLTLIPKTNRDRLRLLVRPATTLASHMDLVRRRWAGVVTEPTGCGKHNMRIYLVVRVSRRSALVAPRQPRSARVTYGCKPGMRTCGGFVPVPQSRSSAWISGRCRRTRTRTGIQRTNRPVRSRRERARVRRRADAS
jgi:putative transposase